MGFRVTVQPKRRAQLVAQSNPGVGDQPEALAWVFYDTQTYIDNSTVELAFFQTTSTDRSITNVPTAGQLPDPQFFEIAYFGCDFLFDQVDNTDPSKSALADLITLLVTGRAFWSFNISDKQIGPFPLTFCHASGGATGIATGFDNVAAGGTPSLISVANNGIFDGGYCVDKAITIPPKVGFNVQVRWPASVQIENDTLLRFWMAGVLHRRVL